MADPKPEGEQIKIKVDGVPSSLESMPPELRAEVEKRIAEARESLKGKFPEGKLRMNINVKWKTSQAALKKAGAAAPPKPAVVVVDEGGFPVPWPFLLVILGAVCAGLYAFVPAFTAAVDAALAAVHRR